MNKQKKMINLRTKKLGLLMMTARQKSQRDEKYCAQIMGVEPEEYLEFERGLVSPSLPQIESFAFFLGIPLEHFWGKNSTFTELNPETQEKFMKIKNIRNRLIGTHLRMARDNSEISISTLSENTSIDVECINLYESGAASVPLSELEILASALGLEMESLFDQQGVIGKWRKRIVDEMKYREIPDEYKDFVSKPVNHPYLDLAIQLSNLSAEKLRGIAESLLEITY